MASKRKRVITEQILPVEEISRGSKKHKAKHAKESAVDQSGKTANDFPIQKFEDDVREEDAPLSSAKSTTKKKRRRREHRQEKEAQIRQFDKVSTDLESMSENKSKPPSKVEEEVVGETDSKMLLNKHKDKKHQKRAKKHGDGEEPFKGSDWNVSDPVGGLMLDVDTVFSSDEKYLLVAYELTIAIYSTSTSLQVRLLKLKGRAPISSFSLSPSSHEHLYLSAVDGTIEEWDWTEGLRLGIWKLSSSIYHISMSKLDLGSDEGDKAKSDKSSKGTYIDARLTGNDPSNSSDILYTVDKKDQGLWMLCAHRLTAGSHTTGADVTTLLEYEHSLTSIKIIRKGHVIVATSGKQLIIGTTNVPGPSKLAELSYIWHFLECPEWISSIDVRMRPKGLPAARDKGRAYLKDSLDIVIGGLHGSIHIYEDLLKVLHRREHNATKSHGTDGITSRKLHWHRNAVLALKWSLDGNYIISGGYETVLALWQLETGRKQDLPHLGAAIESIVVSHTGSSYAVRLADNSAMIVSTSELRPTFSIAGVQIPATRKMHGTESPFVPTVDVPTEYIRTKGTSLLAACLSSSLGGQLLLAVPHSVSSRQRILSDRNASYLQTVDLGSGHQLARQAMTRTNITTLNIGPDSNIIEEPNIIHVQSSHDGQWLATIDEWMPPKRDVAPLAFDQTRATEEQAFRQETYLKFWSWNEDEKLWELVSRVDNPHSSRNRDPYDRTRVLDLASDPSSVGFATIGEDGVVKTWKPAIRRRNGLEVRGKNGKNLGTWHCKHTVCLESARPTMPIDPSGGKFAYSQDGTILAAAIQTSMPTPISIIDMCNGDVKSTQTGLYGGPLFGLGILSKYLIILSHELSVWDLITNQRQYGIKLNTNNLSLAKQLNMTHLTINTGNGLFAVAIPEISESKTRTTVKSRIAVFKPTDPTPLLLTSLPHPIRRLLSAPQKRSFYTIDTAAEIRLLALRQSVLLRPAVLVPESRDSHKGLSNIFGNGQDAQANQDGVINNVGLLTSNFDSMTRERPVREHEAAIISQDRLAQVFDVGPAYAMPPVMELFEQVAMLASGQARA